MKVAVYHNGDDVFVAWKPKGFIPACRGFALLRRRNGVEEPVSTRVGFEGQAHAEGAQGQDRSPRPDGVAAGTRAQQVPRRV
jgi:hypothetical protein